MTSQDKKTLTLKSSETQAPKLIQDVKQLVKTYNERKDEISAEREARRKEHEQRLEENRTKGSAALFEQLKALIPEKVKTYAGYGKSEARLFEFTFNDELKFENCYAKDLLTKGSVVADLQAYLDAEHSEVGEDGKKERAFLVYFNMIGRQQHDRNHNKFGVFVNWDKDSWEGIQKRLSQTSAVRSHKDGQQSRSYGRPRNSGRPRRDDNRETTETNDKDNRGEDEEGFRTRGPRKYTPRRREGRDSREGRDNRDNRDSRPRSQGQRKFYSQKPHTKTSDNVPISHAEASTVDE